MTAVISPQSAEKRGGEFMPKTSWKFDYRNYFTAGEHIFLIKIVKHLLLE